MNKTILTLTYLAVNTAFSAVPSRDNVTTLAMDKYHADLNGYSKQLRDIQTEFIFHETLIGGIDSSKKLELENREINEFDDIKRIKNQDLELENSFGNSYMTCDEFNARSIEIFNLYKVSINKKNDLIENESYSPNLDTRLAVKSLYESLLDTVESSDSVVKNCDWQMLLDLKSIPKDYFLQEELLSEQQIQDSTNQSGCFEIGQYIPEEEFNSHRPCDFYTRFNLLGLDIKYELVSRIFNDKLVIRHCDSGTMIGLDQETNFITSLTYPSGMKHCEEKIK